MDMVEKMKAYSFVDFKFGTKDPMENYVVEVMKEVKRNSSNHIILKGKIDKELGFEEKNSRGIYYPTMIKYLALALENA